MKKLFSRLFVIFAYGEEIDELIEEARKLKEKKEFERKKDYLNLCVSHQQRSPGTHHDTHNCDYCKLLERLSCMKGQSHVHKVTSVSQTMQDSGRA